MAFTSIGYDGSVNERQWAELVPSVGSSTYGVKGAGDLKVTAVPGQPLMVSVAAGSGWGHGVFDTEAANTTIVCDSISSGSRWDLIAVRRDWQPLAGGPTAIAKVTGTSQKAIPGSRKQGPGVQDDQPLALVQWTAGQTQPTSIVDLRCWAGNGGLVANDILALTYLNKLGASVTIAGIEWNHLPGANDMAVWVKSNEVGRFPLFGVGDVLAGPTPPDGTLFLRQEGTQVGTTDNSGFCRITFPKPFPNGLVSVKVNGGDTNLDRAIGAALTYGVAGGSPHGTGRVNDVVYFVGRYNGAPQVNQIHRVNWEATGW